MCNFAGGDQRGNVSPEAISVAMFAGGDHRGTWCAAAVTQTTYLCAVMDDDLRLRSARAERWLPSSRVSTIDKAAQFVDDVGFALLFPAEKIEAPSLWEAVAGEDAEPFATGMDENESLVWAWKDELPRDGLAWYGKFLHRRGSLLSARLLLALYAAGGRTDDHHSIDLSREAHEIAEALRGGPLTTAALRQIVGNRSRYERAMAELHRHLLVTSAGVEAQRSGWPAGIVDLSCRIFSVGGRLDLGYAARRFLETMRYTSPRELSRAYGWSVAAARAELDGLVDAGDAVRSGGSGYRAG